MTEPKESAFAWEPVLEKAWAVALRRLKSLGGGQLTEKKREEILRVGDAEIDKAMGEQATRLGTEMAARGDTTSSFGRRMLQQHKKNTSRAKKELRLELDAFVADRRRTEAFSAQKKKMTGKERAEAVADGTGNSSSKKRRQRRPRTEMTSNQEEVYLMRKSGASFGTIARVLSKRRGKSLTPEAVRRTFDRAEIIKKRKASSVNTLRSYSE